MKQIAKTLAIVLGITCASAFVPAFAASPATVDYDKLMVEMERAPIDFKVDGKSQNGVPLHVKAGNIIEVRFPQFHRAETVWWFDHITPGPQDFFLLQDWQIPPIVDGFIQIHEPGTMTFKFAVKEPGTYQLVFKHGPRASNPADQNHQVSDEQVEFTLEVQ